MSHGKYFNIELEHNGIVETVLCFQDEVNFIMDIDNLKMPKRQTKEIRSCSVSPEGGKVTMGYKDNTEKTFHESLDPSQIALKPWLLKMAFIKDQYVDGAALSDYTYFMMQKQNMKKALWYQYNQLTKDKKRINMWMNKALTEYDQEIMNSRGVNLREEQKPTETDMRILEHMERAI